MASLAGQSRRLTKLSRQLAHEAFDPIWMEGHMSRSQAYGWLARKLRISRSDCHMRMFDVQTCRRVVAICKLLGPRIGAPQNEEILGLR